MNANEAREAVVQAAAPPHAVESRFAAVRRRVRDATALGRRSTVVDFSGDAPAVRDAVVARLRAEGHGVSLDTTDGVHGVSW